MALLGKPRLPEDRIALSRPFIGVGDEPVGGMARTDFRSERYARCASAAMATFVGYHILEDIMFASPRQEE